MRRTLTLKPGRRGPGLVLGTLTTTAVCALAPAVAQARPPQITQGPTVVGTPQVDSTLTAQGAKWSGKPDPSASWQWVRCDNATDSRACNSIGGATRTTYTATAADVGKHLRVLLVVRNDDGWAWALSAASDAVAPKPVPPPPAPAPEPQPEPAPAPVAPAAPAAPQPAAPAPTGGVLDQQTAAPLRMMSPAPIVHIRGRLTRSGARITLLTVRAPRGAQITVRCAGKGCPAERWGRTASLTRVTRFQAVLPAGTRLLISVTKPGRIGKHTLIVIRRGKAPKRLDRCLMPGKRRPVACPAT